jgi:hypothetical protein
MPSAQAPRILIIRTGAIRDTLMPTPLVRALRSAYPNAHLVFVCSTGARDVLRYNPHLDCVVGLAYRHVPALASPEKTRLVRTRHSRADQAAGGARGGSHQPPPGALLAMLRNTPDEDLAGQHLHEADCGRGSSGSGI